MKIKNITKLGNLPVYDISVKDVEHYVLENGVVSHNSGLMYSANQAFIISKAQEKDKVDGKDELVGWNFTMNVEKSRFVKEKSKLPFTVLYESGISKYSGLLDLALKSNHVVKPSLGWLSKVDTSTGEVEAKKYRLKDTHNKEFWDSILNDSTFNDWVKKNFKLIGGIPTADDLDSIDLDDVED